MMIFIAVMKNDNDNDANDTDHNDDNNKCE